MGLPIEQARQVVDQDAAARKSGVPSGVAALGIIPLAVGLAYLVFYYSDPSRKLEAATPRPQL